MHFLTILGIVGLIVGIAGVSMSNSIRPNHMVKASMAMFLALFAILPLATAWLFLQLRGSLKVFQKKLFLALLLSFPFVLVRVVYSAVGDYGNSPDFSVYGGNATIYLCMDVLEEIFAMAITMAFGMSAVFSKDFIKITSVEVSQPRAGEAWVWFGSRVLDFLMCDSVARVMLYTTVYSKVGYCLGYGKALARIRVHGCIYF